MRCTTGSTGQVLALVVTGLLNKQIACELGTTDVTIKRTAAARCAKWVPVHWPIWFGWPRSSKSLLNPVFDQSRIDREPQRW
jgi:hypothetical protein